MTPDELQDFKDLLAAKQLLEVEGEILKSFGAMVDASGEMTDTERAAAKLEIENGLRGYLGDNAYADYEGYVKSLPERTMLRDLRQQLVNVELDMSFDQEDRLIRMMYDERSAAPEMAKIMGESRGLSAPNEEEAVRLLSAYERWLDRVRMRASTILSVDQKPIFDDHMNLQRDAVRIALMESGYLLGGEE